MSAADETALNSELEELHDNRSVTAKIWDACKRMPLGAFGAIVVILMIFAAIFAPVLSPYDPELNNFEAMLAPPSFEYLLGTDQFGRDLFTRIIYGAQTALFVGFACAIIGASVGLVLGVMSAFFGGTFDLIFQRVMDVFLAFPLIILALAVVATFGTKGVLFGTPYRSVKFLTWTQHAPWASPTHASSCAICCQTSWHLSLSCSRPLLAKQFC